MALNTYFLRLIENSLGIHVHRCSITSVGTTQHIKGDSTDFEHELAVNGGGFSCVLCFKGKIPNEDGIKLLEDAISFYLAASLPDIPETHVVDQGLLSGIINGRRIEDILDGLLNALVLTAQFESAGIFMMNEVLLELRGLVFAQRNVKSTGLRFRSRKVRFSRKSALTDVMYFLKPRIINLNEIDDWHNMADCMDGKAYACPLIGADGKAVGIMIAKGGKYTKKSAGIVSFYADLCSLAMISANMRNELTRLKTYEDNFDKIDYASKDLVRIGMLVATVAHELKNPLVAISGFTRRLTNFCSDPVMGNYVSLILSEVARLENLVTEILDYSKTVNLRLERIPLDYVVNETLSLLAENLKLNMINVKVDVGHDIVIYADKNRFNQVLINVIINAIQVMPSGGDLKIYTEESSETIILYIRDTGGGIPAGEIDKIFEPFHSNKHDGTGLGLSLSRKIMTAHGGQITATNYENGASFALILPKTGGLNG